MSLSYCRSRERDVGDGKYKKDSSECLVPMHFGGIV